MIIDLNKDWRIRSDPLQWIVEKRLHGAKAKRHAWEPKASATTCRLEFGAIKDVDCV